MHKLLWIVSSGLLFAAAPERVVPDRITAESLRGNLSFLASDALEGRGTPSRGLDVAAEFIASRFRSAGLEPAAPDGSYFQTARFAEVSSHLEDFRLTLATGEHELQLTGADVRVHSLAPVEIPKSPVLVLPANGAIPAVEGKLVIGDARRWGDEALLSLLQSRHPALILLVSKRRTPARETSSLMEREAHLAPVVRIWNEDAYGTLTAKQETQVSLHLSAPDRKDCLLKNVAGMLRGSDPVLRDQFILVTAHYDHLGLKPDATGDAVYNGANDDGSGTVSVIEVANGLAAMPVHPKRSILFMTFFGEEEGLLGSYYYAAHPLVSLRATVADINLEQMGRTDAADRVHSGEIAFTGAGFSDLPAMMQAAASGEGVKVYTDKSSDDYFARSDNYAFALAGVVAHTVVVAFDFPDYHAVADEWEKIDYANMAKVDRAVAAGVLQIADSVTPPIWSGSKEAATYREAGH